MLPDFSQLRKQPCDRTSTRSLKPSNHKGFSNVKSFQQFHQSCAHTPFRVTLLGSLPLDYAVLSSSHPTSDCPQAPIPEHPPTPAYVQEWRASQVTDRLIGANVRYADGNEAVDLLTHHAISEMGGHAAQYATTPVIKLRQRYSHVMEGGWWVSGLDPLADWQPMDWGQFKPQNPRTSWKNPDKVIKYEAPAKQSTRALFLSLPWTDGLNIAQRHQLGLNYQHRLQQAVHDTYPDAKDLSHAQTLSIVLDRHSASAPEDQDRNFWSWWLSNPKAPIVITEGAKKAGAALTAGYATIALPGVYNGYRSKDRLGNPIDPVLIPDIQAIVGSERPIILAFDQDDKPQTRRNVSIAISRFSQLLINAGCNVSIAQWSSKQGKGLDDLIADQGTDVFHKAIDSALTFEEWQLWQALDNRLTLGSSLGLRAQALTVLTPQTMPKQGILAIAAAKGTGKTNLINSLIEHQPKVLLAGHRISLMRNLCERCGVNYRGDLDKQDGRFITGSGYTLRVGTCVDSLLAIDPKSFEGCDLVLDEVCQVLRHLLTSSTCNQQGKRPVLLSRFRQLLQAARRVIIADADLDDHAIRYIQQLRSQPSDHDLNADATIPHHAANQLFLIHNTFKPPGYAVRFIQAPDSSAITAELLHDLKNGDRIYIATDSKRGSKRIHYLIEELQTQLKQESSNLLLNSDTSGGDTERAFMENPDLHLSTLTLQAVTGSPSTATGLSIEGDHFDKVYGIFYGASSTDADMAQALGRVRAPVPRVVWCAKYGRSFSKAGRETSPRALRSLLKQKTQANTLLIQASLSEVGYRSMSDYDWESDPHIHYWSQIEAQRNRSMWSLRTALKVRLMHEGHQVKTVTLQKNQQAHNLLKEARDELKMENALQVEAAVNLSPADAKLLGQQESLEPEQRLALQKYEIAKFYGLPLEDVDADVVLQDDSGRRRGRLLNLEWSQYPETAIDIDIRALERQGQWQHGYTPWDLSNAVLKQKLRLLLGIDAYLELGKTWESESLDTFKQNTLNYAPQIKAVLNFSVKPEMSAAQILNQLLEQMGLTCVNYQPRREGKRTRIYELDPVVYEQQMEILERRKAIRERATEDDTAPLFNYSITGDCATHTQVIQPLEIGALEQWRWGTSLSPWVIQDEVGQMVTIRGSSGVTFIVGKQELVPWDG
ncbi:MAG: plasmid replication protein, CyRepA1 family [Cyanobacteria bacterium J06635_15]